MVHFGKLCVVFSVKDVFMFIQAGLPCRWTSDGRRFILENFDVIRFSPQQVYNSAILLCPTSSWLHKHCSIGLSQEIRVVVGPAEWRTCIHSVSYSADSLACRNNTVAAAGHVDGRIDILDAITGIRSAVLSGHTQIVWDVAFSSDCTFLVSGSDDNTIRVWDIQTGGTIKMFYGHGTSVSVSVDDAVLASNSGDKLIYLWDIESEQCHTIEQDAKLVTFSPTNPQLLLSVSADSTVQQWRINGDCIGPPVPGTFAAFSPDGTQFVLCKGESATITNTDHGGVVAVLHLPEEHNYFRQCCFSPNGKFIAATSSSHIIYLWDITSSNPHPVKALIGHKAYITSMFFSSSHTLISASRDVSIKLWDVTHLPTDMVASGAETMALTSAPIEAVSLQARDNLALSIDSEGVVKIWDISTGHCSQSIKSPAGPDKYGDMQFISGRLIIVWCEEDDDDEDKINLVIWDSGEVSRIPMDSYDVDFGLRISKDGSRVFRLYGADKLCIQTWSLQTGVLVEEEKLVEGEEMTTEEENLWALEPRDIRCPSIPFMASNPRFLTRKQESTAHGWNFGSSGSTQAQFSTDRLELDIGHISQEQCGVYIVDRATQKIIFKPCERYEYPSCTQWDGQFLINGYGSGEVLILDFGS